MDRKREERRSRLLDVAEKMIAAKGIEGMTMEEVARAADVAAGTTYLHFKNKNALCAAVLARIVKQAAAAEAEAAESCETGSEKLLAYRKALAGFSARHPEKREVMRQLRRIDFDEEDADARELISEYNRVAQLVAGFYHEGIEEGTIRPGLDPVPAAIFLQLALTTASDLPKWLIAVLRMNDVDPGRWANVTDDLLTAATHAPRRKDPAESDIRPGHAKRKRRSAG